MKNNNNIKFLEYANGNGCLEPCCVEKAKHSCGNTTNGIAYRYDSF